MKKIAIALIFAVQCIVQEVSATIYITTTVTWNTPTFLNDDVIIEPTGQLLIYADVEVGKMKSIRVKDGGQLFAINTRFFGTSNKEWKGITCDATTATPTNLLALKLIGCQVEDAQVAVFFSGGIHRNYHFRATTFTDNGAHFYAESNTKKPFQSGEIIACEFLKATALWPILLHRPMNLSVYNSTFNYSPTAVGNFQRGIHMDGPENVLISGSDFIRVGRYGVSMHYVSKNVEIRENTFHALPPFSFGQQGLLYAAIELGSEVPSSAEEILITKNNFVNADLSNTIGIVGIWADDITLSDLVISDNNFQDYNRGVDIQNVVSGTNLITNNDFYNYDVAIKFRDANPGLDILDIHCNRFLVGNPGSTAIDGTQGTVTSSAVEIDPMNEFINTVIDIEYSLPSGYLEYAIHSTNLYPPTVITGVNMSTANNFNDCKVDDGGTGGGDPSGGGQEYTGSIFPNPAIDHVTIQFEGKFEYLLLDSKGSVVLNGHSEDRETISISDLNPGVYFVRLSNDTEQTTEKLIVH